MPTQSTLLENTAKVSLIECGWQSPPSPECQPVVVGITRIPAYSCCFDVGGRKSAKSSPVQVRVYADITEPTLLVSRSQSPGPPARRVLKLCLPLGPARLLLYNPHDDALVNSALRPPLSPAFCLHPNGNAHAQPIHGMQWTEKVLHWFLDFLGVILRPDLQYTVNRVFAVRDMHDPRSLSDGPHTITRSSTSRDHSVYSLHPAASAYLHIAYVS
ncbi:hypothetical protein LIA77_08344 [Sarocladium implicatum]|nr:hypothetical protein LIA77_08344 [Sarocladium implicatum]